MVTDEETQAAQSRESTTAAATTAPSPNAVQPTDEDLPDADAEQAERGQETEQTHKEQDLPTGTHTETVDTQPEAQQHPSEQQPPPPPPPPGPRATRLQQLFDSSLQHTLSKVSWDNFAACYPTAATRAPGALKTVHKAMVARLAELCAAEFALVLKNRQVVQKLNELEELAAAAGKRRQEEETKARAGGRAVTPAPAPHTLPPETVLAAHLAPQRREQAAQLRVRLQQVQAANAERFSLLSRQQTEAEQLVSSLEQALADAQGAATLLDGDGLVDEVAQETRTAEVEMSGV